MNKKSKRVVQTVGALVSMLTLVAVLTSCEEKKDVGESTSFFAMDTLINVTIYDDIEAESVFKQVNETIMSLENQLSVTKDGSTMYNLNKKCEISVDESSDLLYDIIVQSLELTEKTNGSFDFSLGNLINLWDINAENPHVPSDTDIKKALAKTGVSNIELSEDKILLSNGVQLNMGAIAKGYASDMLVDFFEENGIDDALMSLGGNVYLVGDNNGELFKVGISDPTQKTDYIGYLTLGDTSVVTSGDYERYFEVDGKRYHHILDPKTGYPSDNELSSVTIVSENSTYADAISTASFVMGLEAGLDFVEGNADLEGMFITKDNKIYLTEGLEDIFVLQDDDFVVESR